MANISDKTNLTQHGEVLPTVDWISQINAGGKTYDIATHHNIIFKDGSADTTGVKWNGLTDLEVVIPSITDIVQTPIEFAGTVGADGEVTWNAEHTDGPKTGYLVFVTANCTFAGQACEAGDMAIHDGAKWNIVSGENQVKIVNATDKDITDANRTVVAVGAAKDVLVVEGKALSLTLDYTDLNDKHLSVTKGDPAGEDVIFDTMTVGSVGIKLNKADNEKIIGEEKSITYGTELANGTVALTGATGLVNGINWGKFDAGTQTTSKSNTQKDLTVTGGSLTLSPGLTSGDFVESVVINPVTFKDADDNEDGSIKMLTAITAVSGAEFFNDIHVTTDKETADLTIAGYISPVDGVNAKYVKGLEGNLTPVTSISAGNFELVEGTALATGFGNESTSGDVVSSVSVTAKNDTSVLKTAKVENHVLSFDPVNVASDVTTTCSYKSLTKTGFKYTAPVATNTSFTTSGFEQIADVKYTFGRGQETTYTTSASSWKLDTPALTVSYGKYGFNDAGMKADVPAGTFVTSVTAGNLPSLGESTLQTVNVTGTVGTALTTSEIKFNALKSDKITMPAYTLGTVEKDADITVGAAGKLAASDAHIDLSGYVTGVSIK